MKQWTVLLTCFLISAAMLSLSAFADDAEPAEVSSPTYSVEVTRNGKMLNIAIKTESRQQQDLLFGEHWQHTPTLEIYKGDLLLESGSFAFG